MKYAFLAALLIASPAAAQDRMTPDQCNGSWGALEMLVGGDISDSVIEPDNEGWCQIKDGIFTFDGTTRAQFASLRWRASDIGRFIDGQLMPRSVEIKGQGFGVLPETGDPVYDYLLAVQTAQSQSGFGLTLRWDGLQNIVTLTDAFVEFSAGNRIEITARIDGANLTDQATTQTSIGSMGLRDLIIRSDFDGWFESYVVFPLGSALLSSGTISPEEQVAGLRRQAVDLLSKIPEENLSEASQDALSAFVMSLPNPRGQAQLQLNADPTLGAARMAPFAVLPEPPTFDQIVELGLGGVNLQFTWTPTVRAR